jgi:hypothetical protein
MADKNYRVTWEIDITADSPEEAAMAAKQIQQDPESCANVFCISEADNGSFCTVVDLDVIDERRRSEAVETPDTQQKRRKPFSMRIQANIYYDIPAESLPSWATDKGVKCMAEEAFHDHNRKLNLAALSAQGVLRLSPSEVVIEGIAVEDNS